MFSFHNFFSQFVSRFLTLLLTGLFGGSSLIGGIGVEPAKTPDGFTPVLRFAVCSDVHLNGDPDQRAAVRLGQMLDDAYAYADASVYPKLDAVLSVGDFADSGAPEEYEVFNNVTNAHLREETQLLCVLGNHEFIRYRDEDASVAYDVYKRYICEEVDRHDVIGGYHFIGVSYEPDGKSFSGKLPWLKAQLDAAIADAPEKPVFVYEHPHPFATVYGSVNWGDFSLRTLLEHYPQAVVFSGHSHYCAADPRSIWQGGFTAVGTGSLSAFMGNLNYINGDEDAPGASGGFWIVEADRDGNLRLRLYDIENRCFFDNIDYYLHDLTSRTAREYTWGNQISHDTAPLFPAGAAITAETDGDGNTVLRFPDAAGYYEAENYKINIYTDAFHSVFSTTVISDYVRAGLTGAFAEVGELPAGTYHVAVTAYSPYAKQGATLKGDITVR